jgi:peroxiredoxin Q/BCP
VVRSTFLITPEGVIAKSWEKVKVKNHAREVQNALCELKA